MTTSGLAALALAWGMAGPASADPVADFYQGKTVTIIVAAGPGGNHSRYSLLLGPYFKKYTPGNPNFIIKNMGGAGGTKAANYLYNSAPQDGSHIGILLSDTAMAGRLRAVGIKYDPKKFKYLGGADYTRSMITVMKTAGVNSIADAKKKEIIFGSTGKGSQTYTIPIVVNHFLGTKFKVITGYRGMNGVDAAVDKGEVQARAGVYSSIIAIRPHWLEKKLVVHLGIADLEPNPNEPDVPLLIDMTEDKDAKDVMTLIFGSGVLGRGWLAPPGVPDDRVAALRESFWKSFNDPQAQAEMKKRRMHVSPVRWEKQQAAVTRIADTPDRIIRLAREALGLKSK
jgi:tripartite-type tricarboxylate transporter receptor subunit TctC